MKNKGNGNRIIIMIIPISFLLVWIAVYESPGSEDS